MHVTEVEHEITSKHMLQFPEVMKHLQLIIEFSDCILQGKDLLSYDIVIDEDLRRVADMHKLALEKTQGLPNKGQVHGVSCSPAKVPHKEDGIIKENVKVPFGR